MRWTEGIWSVSQICAGCRSGWGLILVPVCRCGGDLLGFGSCRAIELLEQAMRVLGEGSHSRSGLTGSGGGWGGVDAWMG